MTNRKVKTFLLGCAGAGVLLAATVSANAGGFAVREQSAWGQGTSYAGVAAGGDLSAMFWNPATMTQKPGLNSESVLSGILPYSANMVGAGTFAPAVGLGGTGNTAQDALVPGSYYSWQFNRDMWLGLSINAPFGLSVSSPTVWAGDLYGAGSTYLRTYNATPSFAYKLSDMISVGLGVQIQYAKADLSHCALAPCGLGGPLAELSGTGWGYGFTAGVTVTPTPTTTVGIGYRSAMNQKVDGTLALSAPASVSASASTTLNLPGTLSVGLRQILTSQWTGLATVEWTNWSRIGTSAVAAGALSTTVPFQYSDGWLFSVGAEYAWDPKITLRGGLGYEKSPITDDVRIPLLADNDRYWVSLGGTYKWSPKLSFDLAYSHLFVKNTPINVIAGNPSFVTPFAYVGTVDSHIDIISVAMKYRWDDPAPPVKQGYFKAK